ncbi:unnamed protein product, partial [Ceratitis capitata]
MEKAVLITSWGKLPTSTMFDYGITTQQSLKYLGVSYELIGIIADISPPDVMAMELKSVYEKSKSMSRLLPPIK